MRVVMTVSAVRSARTTVVASNEIENDAASRFTDWVAGLDGAAQAVPALGKPRPAQETTAKVANSRRRCRRMIEQCTMTASSRCGQTRADGIHEETVDAVPRLVLSSRRRTVAFNDT